MRRATAAVLITALALSAVGAPAAGSIDREQVLCITLEYDAEMLSGLDLIDQSVVREAIDQGWARVSDPERCTRPADEPASLPDKYEQTWPVEYGKTTCDDYVGGAMDEHQRFVMAADMLLSMRLGNDPDATLPSDDDVNAFAFDLSIACDVGDSASSLLIALRCRRNRASVNAQWATV